MHVPTARLIGLEFGADVKEGDSIVEKFNIIQGKRTV